MRRVVERGVREIEREREMRSPKDVYISVRGHCCVQLFVVVKWIK